MADEGVEVIKLNRAGIQFDEPEPEPEPYDDYSAPYEEPYVPPPPPEDEKRKKHLKRFIAKAKSGPNAKYFDHIDCNTSGKSQAELEETWVDIKNSISAAKSELISALAPIAVGALEAVASMVDEPGAATGFTAACMNDKGFLEDVNEVELWAMEQWPDASAPLKLRLPGRLALLYMDVRSRNLSGKQPLNPATQAPSSQLMSAMSKFV